MKFDTTKVKKLWKRSLFGDYDGDGVMNAFDCQPKNKKKQETYPGEDFDNWQEKQEENKKKGINKNTKFIITEREE